MRQTATAAVALVALALAGCSSGDFDDQVPEDATLTVYVGSPLRGESGQEGRAIVNGAKLALEAAGGEAGGVDVEPVYMDDTGGEGEEAHWDPVVVADNARRAAQDSTAIAYIGDLESGATRVSLPITNQAQMLQVSAASTGVDLTRTSSASDEVPVTQPTGERTFGRVIPDDEKQAGAGAVWAKKLGVRSATVVRDKSDFGDIVGDEFEEEAEALGIAIEPERAELCYLAAEAAVFELHCTQAMATDGLFGKTRAGLLTSSAQAPEQLPAPQGEDFIREYQDSFGEPPDRYAAYGYEAMAVVLDSIERADDPRDRSAVIDAFFATVDRESVLGTYSIDEAGDTTLDAIAGYRLENGEPRFDSALRAP